MDAPATTILVTLDPTTAAELDRLAPARSRKRSDFIRMAIRRALWEQDEARTAAAYARQPDGAEPAFLDSAAWEARATPWPQRPETPAPLTRKRKKS